VRPKDAVLNFAPGWRQDASSDVETLLRNADQAMYAAKHAGRNCVRVFAPMLQVSTAAHAALVSDLHGALANNQIELHYQPIVEIATGRVVKAEALARWRHPKHGYVPPSEFIPIAEETGLIVEIGDWAFRRAAAQALRWRRSFDPEFQISVNVSAIQLAATDGLAANFDRLVTRTGLGPGAMIIEITESVLIDSTETVRNHFARYRRRGSNSRSTTSAPAIRRLRISRTSTSATSRSIAPSSPVSRSAHAIMRSARRWSQWRTSSPSESSPRASKLKPNTTCLPRRGATTLRDTSIPAPCPLPISS
jgi:hypothetical protein